MPSLPLCVKITMHTLCFMCCGFVGFISLLLQLPARNQHLALNREARRLNRGISKTTNPHPPPQKILIHH